jgi:hypothetical protein
MSEIGDLIAILGAVDQAVHADEGEERRSLVAALVKPYRTGERFGWYEGFVGREGNEALPRLEEAVENLRRPTRFAGMLPRRVLAVTLAARVFPDLFGPGGERADVSVRALTIPGIVAGLPLVPTPPLDEPPDVPDLGDPSIQSQGEELLRALADPDRLSRIEDWHEFLRSTSHLVSSQLLSLPAPCSTTVIEPPTGGDDAVVVLQTSLCVGGVDLDVLAARFLDPTNWPTCSPWWCQMLRAPGGGPGIKRFLEVVAADCPNRIFEVAVFLDFATAIDGATRKVVTYNMSTDQSGMVGGLRANNAVEVDRGVIDVRRERDHFRVETTKRIRFAQPVDADALAVVACFVGYGDVAADVICDCSGGTPEAVDCDVDEAPAPGRLTPAVNRFVDLARKCVTEGGDLARQIAGRVDEGSYTPDLAAEDATTTAALALRGLATLATTTVEAIKDLASPPAAPTTQESAAFAFRGAIPDNSALALAGPLLSPYGDRIDTGRVEIRPSTLSSGGEFRLLVDIAGLEGSAYTGEVTAVSPATGGAAASVDVDVIVP